MNTTTKAVYVAAPFGFYEAARRVIDSLAEHDIQTTHDWTRTTEFGPDGTPRPEAELDSARMVAAAEHDLAGVEVADALIVLPWQRTTGWAVELGYFLAANPTGPVLLCAPPEPTPVGLRNGKPVVAEPVDSIFLLLEECIRAYSPASAVAALAELNSRGEGWSIPSVRAAVDAHFLPAGE